MGPVDLGLPIRILLWIIGIMLILWLILIGMLIYRMI